MCVFTFYNLQLQYGTGTTELPGWSDGHRWSQSCLTFWNCACVFNTRVRVVLDWYYLAGAVAQQYRYCNWSSLQDTGAGGLAEDPTERFYLTPIKIGIDYFNLNFVQKDLLRSSNSLWWCGDRRGCQASRLLYCCGDGVPVMLMLLVLLVCTGYWTDTVL